MKSDEAFLTAVDALERTNTPYLVVGSMACNVYTIPRSTKDADFVIQLAGGGEALLRELRGIFRVEPQMSFETVTGTTRYLLEVAQTGFRIELFLLSDDAHDQSRFARRRQVEAEGRHIWVATAEDVVITKLRWSRQGKRGKDTDDVRNVIASTGPTLDWSYIHHWCEQHGTRALLDELRASIPPVDTPG